MDIALLLLIMSLDKQDLGESTSFPQASSCFGMNSVPNYEIQSCNVHGRPPGLYADQGNPRLEAHHLGIMEPCTILKSATKYSSKGPKNGSFSTAHVLLIKGYNYTTKSVFPRETCMVLVEGREVMPQGLCPQCL